MSKASDRLRAASAVIRRRPAAWGSLAVIAIGVLLVRSISPFPIASGAADRFDGREGSVPMKPPQAFDPASDSLEIRRDLFAWESVFDSPAPMPAADPSEAARAASQALRLQAVMLGDEPRAVVNGRVYRVGEAVGEFVIRRIERRGIVVQKDDVAVNIDL